MTRESRYEGRSRRHERVRERVRGSARRPRLAVFRSLSHIYAQLIDDDARRTLAAASSVDARIGEQAKAKGIAEAVFDRGGYRYHGRVKALGDAARSAGLKF